MGINNRNRHKLSPSVPDILKSLSDEKSLVLFRTLARNQNHKNDNKIQSTYHLTKKQLYSRLSRMTRVGLIKRRNGKYSPTSLGKLVYDFQIHVQFALDNYWKLKAADTLAVSPGIQRNDYVNFVDTLIDNSKIKDALLKIDQ
jgi:DNA-binding HxlR family transcriptional regulator